MHYSTIKAAILTAIMATANCSPTPNDLAVAVSSDEKYGDEVFTSPTFKAKGDDLITPVVRAVNAADPKCEEGKILACCNTVGDGPVEGTEGGLTDCKYCLPKPW